MRYWFHVTNGIVDEVFSLDDIYVPGKNVFAQAYAKDVFEGTKDAAVGMKWDGKALTNPAAPAPGPVTVAIPDVDAVQALIQLARTPSKNEAHPTLYDHAKAILPLAGVEAGIWFEKAQRWERANPYVVAIATALGLSPAETDTLFVEAKKITAPAADHEVVVEAPADPDPKPADKPAA